MEEFPRQNEQDTAEREPAITDQQQETIPSQPYNLEQFDYLPNRKTALRAITRDNCTVFLRHAIARKLYRCPCCKRNIEIGSEHVILSRVQLSKNYNHHHIDIECVHEFILPELRSIHPIDAEKASVNHVYSKIQRRRKNIKQRQKRKY